MAGKPSQGEGAVLLLSLLFAGLVVALVLYARTARGIDLPGCISDVKGYEKPEVVQLAPDHYQIRFVARMWTFLPGDIRIPSGSTVDIFVVSQDVVHGLHIPGTPVNLMAIPGSVGFARVRFDKPGVYYVRCHEFCGAGHHLMETRIVVEESR